MTHENGAQHSKNNHRLYRRLRRQYYLAQPASEPVLPAPLDVQASEAGGPAHSTHGHTHHPVKHPPVAEFEKTIETLRDQLVRTQAEFDNYRKRQRRDEQQRLDLANQGLLEQLLPVLDNFSRALANPGDSLEGLLGGIQMVQQQFCEILRQNGLEKVEAQGQPFDPNKHEAVCVEATEEVPDGQVVDVFQDGYALKGRLIRPAMVKVARNP